MSQQGSIGFTDSARRTIRMEAKAVAELWKFPLLRLDVGALFSGASASPEAAMREAIKVSESLSPVVLWIDEIEKGFVQSEKDESTTRVFGSLITWLAEKKAQVFVVATANDVSLNRSVSEFSQGPENPST